jgi:hypothetical protein
MITLSDADLECMGEGGFAHIYEIVTDAKVGDSIFLSSGYVNLRTVLLNNRSNSSIVQWEVRCVDARICLITGLMNVAVSCEDC